MTPTTSPAGGAGLLGPRLVVAGTHSGVGKTTVATGLLAALRRAGHRPAGAKVGPDFIDPGYHALACGRAPRNLDAWLCGAEVIEASDPTALAAAIDRAVAAGGAPLAVVDRKSTRLNSSHSSPSRMPSSA